MFGMLLAAAMLMAGATPEACDLACEQRVAVRQMERGEIRAAIEGLKRARERFPDDRRLIMLLVRAYLLEDNLFWAERTLREATEKWPDDIELRTWLAAVHLRQGDPDLVRADLPPELHPDEDPVRSRWQLLVASEARLSNDADGARDALARINRKSALYPEDRTLWTFLSASSNRWWSPSITGSLDLGLGGTSNALAGSPTDPGMSGDASSLALIDLRGRLVPSVGAAIRPALDLRVVGQGLGEEEYRDLSTLLAGIRVGAVVMKDEHRFGFGVRSEALWLNQEESLYSEAYRGEFEVEWKSGSVAFGGGGRRSYRDQGRSRWEADVGFGGPLVRIDGGPVVGGATLLLADAESPAYDQVGFSAAISARIGIIGGTALELAVKGAWDDYLNSGGEEGLRVFGTEDKRRDLLGRAALTLRFRPSRRLQPRCELWYTQRWSTADEAPGFDFSYREWRFEAWLRWSFSADPWAPKTTRPRDHVPLDWGVESTSGVQEDRILDLLRRDEELRRSSSCGLR